MPSSSSEETTSIDPMLDMLDMSETHLKEASGTFQAFAKLVGGKTVTLNDLTTETTLAALYEKIGAKDKIPTDQKYLVSSGKNLYPGPETISSKGIGKDSTVYVMMRLRGGFGEVAAVKHTLDEGIERGNNAQTIEKTGGKSRAHKDWGRHIAGQDVVYQNIFQLLRSKGVHLTQEWWEENRIHVRALIQEVTGAGNCGDFAQIVHSQLVANTEGQHVYQVVMAGAWDHQLCLTYPSKVSSVTAMDQMTATIADGWDNYMVIPLKKFLNGSNCYGAKIKNFDKCPECGDSSGSGCKTEEDKDKKCKGFLKIVAQQECKGGGGLPTEAKESIKEYIGGMLEDWQKSEDYTEYLEKVKDDKRGIFRFSVADDVTDKRSRGDILEKLGLLLKAKAPTLKAELLELEDADLVAVFGDGETWRDTTLGIAEVKARLYTAITAQSTEGFLQGVNHLTEPQFIAYFDADSAHAAKVLATDYAALRYHGYLSKAGDSEVVTRCEALSDADFIKFYDSGEDGKSKVLNAAGVRSLFFALLLRQSGDELTRLVGSLGEKLGSFFGTGEEARKLLMGNDTLRSQTFDFLFKAGSDMPGLAAHLKPPHLIEFFLSSKNAAKLVIGSSMKEPLYEAIDVAGSMGVPVLLKFPKRAFMEYAESTADRTKRVEGSPELKERYDALSESSSAPPST